MISFQKSWQFYKLRQNIYNFWWFFFVVPKYLEELKIPNPFTDRMEFYNQVLHELYAVIGDTLAPSQLKGYIITQREVRWKCKDETKRLSSYLSNISDGKSGQALNVKNIHSKPLQDSRLKMSTELEIQLMNSTNFSVK